MGVRLVGGVAAVIEMYGYPPIRALADVKRLQEALNGFLHVDREPPTPATPAEKGAVQ